MLMRFKKVISIGTMMITKLNQLLTVRQNPKNDNNDPE